MEDRKEVLEVGTTFDTLENQGVTRYIPPNSSAVMGVLLFKHRGPLESEGFLNRQPNEILCFYIHCALFDESN